MARGRWLRKMANKVKDKVEDVKEDVMEKISTNGQLGGMNLGPACEKLKGTTSRCHEVAKETIALCKSTTSQGDQMVEFGAEITGTMRSFASGGMDASVLETIKNLTSGDKLDAAMDLASHMDDAAVKCIDKSIEMIDMLEDSMDELPDAVEKMLHDAAEKNASEGDKALLTLKDLDQDVEDVTTCVSAIRELNIATAFTVGLKAFEQLSSKAKKSRAMFDSIKGFSSDVESLTNDMKSLDVVALSSRLKDVLRIIHLSELMRKFAEGTKRIIEVITELFKVVSERISTLWASLAFAKDCMSDCVEHVVKAKTLCLDAKDKSLVLMERTISVKNQLDNMGDMNARSVKAVRELSKGGEIQEAIDLAKGMDDLVLDCTKSVTDMVDRVTEGFQNLPDILTKGFDLTEAGKKEKDPEPVDVEDNIKDLENAKEAMDSSDIFTATKSGVRGFSSVHENASTCKDLLGSVEAFSKDCDGTIESFMSVWDLESAMEKFKEMCRLVSLGELIKQFSSQIKRLLLAILAMLKSAVEKLSSLDIKDLKEAVGNAVEDAVGGVFQNQGVQKITEGVGKLVGNEKVDNVVDEFKDKFGDNMKKFGRMFG